MVLDTVQYHTPAGAIVRAKVLHEFGENDVRSQQDDAGNDLAKPDEIAAARAGRRQVNLIYISADPADTNALGRSSYVATSVPHKDHYDAKIDAAHGFWQEVVS